MEYDDEAELTRYVWDYYEHLMTDFEQRVGRAIFGRMKAAICKSPTQARLTNERRGMVGTPEIDAALAEGIETYRRRTCRRVLADHGSEVFVNRCPQCNGVVRTPQAQQCFWCGHDWHSPPS
jgi:hypothetical protein